MTQDGRDWGRANWGSDSAQSAEAGLLAALNDVIQLGGSDLHISVDSIPMVRVDGELRFGQRPAPWGLGTVVAALDSILTPAQRALFAADGELDFAYTLSSSARFRVNFYRQGGSVAAAFRLIPTAIKSLAELGLPEVVSGLARVKRGLVLVTGATGSGKSTTLAALIDLVNATRSDHIVTIEDPIEFLHTSKRSRVNQREVGRDTASFSVALKRVLRQDPDVILIGELRDRETIGVALTAAETGHLVFATLHTLTAAQTIDRIVDVFSAEQQSQVRSQLASTLKGVVGQTLIPRAQGSGRVVATEVMLTTPAIANLIREGKTFQIPSAMQVGQAFGMHTLDQNLAELVSLRQISREAALEVAEDGAELTRMMGPEMTDSFDEDRGAEGGVPWR